MGVALVERGLPSGGAHHTPRGKAAQHLLIHRPQRPRRHERLVVKARRQHPAHRLIDRPHVVAERRPDVLCPHHHPRLCPSMRAAHIGLVAYLHQTAGVEETGREDAARPVVLEATRDDPLARGRQRRDDGVARIGGNRGAVPTEGERLRSVDHLARLRPQAHGGRGGRACALHPPTSPPGGLSRSRRRRCASGCRAARISLRTVCRSRVKKRRHPAW